MVYVVFAEFDKVRDPSKDLYIVPNPVCYYFGTVKDDAIEAFNNRVNSVFSTSVQYDGYLHFSVFDSEATFLEDIGIRENPLDIPIEDIYKVKKNLSLALCDNTLRYTRPKTVRVAAKCGCCKSTDKNLQKNAYGTWLCDDCWDNYWLRTSEGQIEYLIGLTTGEYSLTAFSTLDQIEMVKAWELFAESANKSESELNYIRTAAEAAGLNFSLTE